MDSRKCVANIITAIKYAAPTFRPGGGEADFPASGSGPYVSNNCIRLLRSNGTIRKARVSRTPPVPFSGSWAGSNRQQCGSIHSERRLAPHNLQQNPDAPLSVETLEYAQPASERACDDANWLPGLSSPPRRTNPLWSIAAIMASTVPLGRGTGRPCALTSRATPKVPFIERQRSRSGSRMRKM